MSTTETSESPRQAVVIFDAPAAPFPIAEILAEVAGLQPTDALIHARAAPGVLPDRFSPEMADRLVQRFAAIGLSAAATDPAELVDFHFSDVVHRAVLRDEGLVFATDHGGF